MDDAVGVELLWLPASRGLCWGVGVGVGVFEGVFEGEGEGEGEGDPDDLVVRGGMRACWAVREADGPCRGPWEVFMGGG